MSKKYKTIIVEESLAKVYTAENGRRYFRELYAYQKTAKIRLQLILHNRSCDMKKCTHIKKACDGENCTSYCDGRCNFETECKYWKVVRRFARKLRAKNRLISEDQKKIVRILKIQHTF
jgi:hypothetical protein